jgi:hypothetical protein
LKEDREQFEADRVKERAVAQMGGAMVFQQQLKNQEVHEQVLLKNSKEQNDLTSHVNI